MTKIDWKYITGIKSLPEDFWENHISKGDILKPQEFVEILERSSKQYEYKYIVAYVNNQIVGFAYVSFFTEDLIKSKVPEMFKKIRTVFPNFLKINIVMTGAMETVGTHWWYDNKVFSEATFFNELYQKIKQCWKSASVIIVRDFILESSEFKIDAEIRKVFRGLSFCMAESWPFARIEIDKNIKGIDDYLKTLKVSGRRPLKRAVAEHAKNGFKFKEIENYEKCIEEIYSLYLQTSNNADDFKRDALPKEFFIEIAKEKKLQSSIQIILNSDDKIIAFVLSIRNKSAVYPYLLGRDYSVDDDVYLIYQIYYFIILSAINSGVSSIELGITSYFIKQRMGAKLKPMYLFIRMRGTVLNFLLKPILHKLVK